MKKPPDLRIDYLAMKLPGQQGLFAYHPEYGTPIGHIYFQEILVDVLVIGYVFVHERYRRLGVAAAMIRDLRANAPEAIIATAVANSFSRPWLLAMGFIKEPNGWFLRPPAMSEPCPMI